MNITTLGQGAKVLELILQKETNSERMQNLLKSGLLADLLDADVGNVNREDFRKLLGLGKLMPDIMELTGVVLPDKSITFSDRIAAGDYRWKDNCITEKRFPLTLPAGPRNLVLVNFKQVITTQKVETWAKKNGYEVALFDDLLAVGSHSKYKELQRQFPIIQLGSSEDVFGYWSVPCLNGNIALRCMGLSCWNEDDWNEDCRFLLVRPASPSLPAGKGRASSYAKASDDRSDDRSEGQRK